MVYYVPWHLFMVVPMRWLSGIFLYMFFCVAIVRIPSMGWITILEVPPKKGAMAKWQIVYHVLTMVHMLFFYIHMYLYIYVNPYEMDWWASLNIGIILPFNPTFDHYIPSRKCCLKGLLNEMWLCVIIDPIWVGFLKWGTPQNYGLQYSNGLWFGGTGPWLRKPPYLQVQFRV